MVANPFENSGTSSYPVENPYIGQSDAFSKIQKSLSLAPNSRPHTTLIYGDWGAGKTRLGHQVVAETTGESPSWYTKTETGYERKELISDAESNPVSNTVLPLWVHLSECKNEIRSDNAARVLLNQGFENLINGEKPIHKDIQSHLNDYATFHELENVYRTNTGAPSDRLKDCLDTILDDTGIDRITVIVDEVEEASSIGTTAPEDEDTEGISGRTIQALYEGLKEAHNDQGTKYPDNMFADFMLLCTDNVDNFIPSGGVERRVDPVRLSRPTIEDATQYVRKVKEQTEIGVDISDQCIAALFFASFNNYGWFTRAMSDIVFYKQREERPFYEILREQRGQFSDLLDKQIIDDILDDSESVIGSDVVDALYRLRPTDYTEIQTTSDSIDELTEYETPLEGYSPISQLAVIDTSPENIKRQLRQAGFDGSQDADGNQAARIAGEKLDPNRLQDILQVFSTSDRDLALYTEEEDLKDLAEFAFGQGQINENAISALVDALREMESSNEIISDTHVGPSISFLNEWNVRWRKISSVVQWINDDETWEEMLAAARDVEEEWNERVTKGAVHTRFQHYATGAPDLDSHDEIDSTNFVTQMPEGDVANVVKSEEAVFINYQDYNQLRQDLSNLQRVENSYPIVYIITTGEDEEEDRIAELREDFGQLSPFLNQLSISPRGLEEEFYVQMSFLGQEQDGGFDQEMILTSDEEYLTNHRQQPLKRSDESWLESRESEGWVLHQVVHDHGDPEILAKGVIDWARERSGDWRDEETIQEWDNANTASGVVSLIRVGEDASGDTFELPNFILKVLHVLDTRGPMQVGEIAGQFLYDISEDRRISTAVQNLLEMLEGMAVITETDEGYKFVDADYLRTEIVQKAISEIPDDLSEFYEEFYYRPSDQTKIDFRIDTSTLDEKASRLEEMDQDIKEINHDTLTGIGGDQEEWLDAVKEEHAIVSEVRTVHRPGEDDPDIENISNEKLSQVYHEVRIDDEHEEYSIAYRLHLLEQFDDILKADCTDLGDVVDTKRKDVENTYNSVVNGEERDFPTDLISSLLDDVDEDLEVTVTSDDVHEVLVPSNSDSSGATATIQDHIENQDFADAFNRLDWYLSAFTKPAGFFASFIDAFEEFNDLVAQYTDFKPKWDETVEYIDDSPKYSDQITDVEIPLVGIEHGEEDVSSLVGETSDPSEIQEIWKQITESPDEMIISQREIDIIDQVVADPVDVLGGQSPADLYDEIQTLQRKLKSIKLHCSIINAVADNYLTEKKAQLNAEWEPLGYAASVFERVDIEIDKTHFEDQDGLFAKKQAIKKTLDDIPEEGQRLFTEIGERAQLWDKYKQAYTAGKEDRDITDGDVSENILDKLTELDLIEYEERFSISID